MCSPASPNMRQATDVIRSQLRAMRSSTLFSLLLGITRKPSWPIMLALLLGRAAVQEANTDHGQFCIAMVAMFLDRANILALFVTGAKPRAVMLEMRAVGSAVAGAVRPAHFRA